MVQRTSDTVNEQTQSLRSVCRLWNSSQVLEPGEFVIARRQVSMMESSFERSMFAISFNT